MQKSSFPYLCLFSSLLLATPLWAQSDQVNPIKGTPARGTVTSVSSTEVVLRVGNSNRRYPVNEIRKVAFSTDPRELARARDLVLRGRYSEADAIVSKLDLASINKPLVQRDAEFYQAYSAAKVALTGGGDRKAAAAKLTAFLTKHGVKSHHYFAATEISGDLELAEKRYSKAAQLYAKLASAPWADYKLRSSVLEARALVAQGKFVDAQKRYASVINGSATSAQALAQRNLAKVGNAICLAETNRAADGIKILRDVIQKNDATDKLLFGRAYNALGRCYLKTKRQEDALLAYLKVHLLFFTDPDAHAESLYHLSKLWRQVKKSDRAVRARTLLRSKYAGSVWATLE